MSNLLLINKTGAIIDCVALLILIITVTISARNGFVKTFFSVFGGVVSFVIAILLCSTVARAMEDKFGIITSVSAWLEGVLNNVFGHDLMNTTLQQANERSLAEAGLTKWILEIVLSFKDAEGISPDVTLNKIISPVFSYYIVAGLSVIVLYIIFKIIFYLFGEIIKKMHKFAPVRAVDGLLGAVLGIIRGIGIIYSILMFISILPFGFVQNISQEINNTVITAFFSKINVFEYIMSKVGGGSLVDIVLGSIIGA